VAKMTEREHLKSLAASPTTAFSALVQRDRTIEVALARGDALAAALSEQVARNRERGAELDKAETRVLTLSLALVACLVVLALQELR